MSDHWIRIIPRDAEFIPSPEAIARAELLMAELAPEASEVTSEVSEGVVFQDCGANFERVFCPVCQADVPMEWWLERMGEHCWEGGSDLRPLNLPCGHTVPSLNEVGYFWDQGFSRYVLDAMNPNIHSLTDEQLRQFGDVLGCEVKVIYRHL